MIPVDPLMRTILGAALGVSLVLPGCAAPREGDDEHSAEGEEHAEHGDEHAGEEPGEHAEHGEEHAGEEPGEHAEHGEEQAGEESGEHAEHGEEHEGEEDEHGGHDEHEGEGELAETVSLSLEAVARAGIAAVAIESGRLGGTVPIPAVVEIDPARIAHVSSLVDGVLGSVQHREGDRVEAGDQLAMLESIAVGEARAGRALARTRRTLAHEALARAEELYSQGMIPESQLAEAEAAVEEADAMLASAEASVSVIGRGGGGDSQVPLVAPMAGEILEAHAVVGEAAHPGDSLFVLGDLSTVWVVGHLGEAATSLAEPGYPVRIALPGAGSETLSATITRVAPTVDPETRTIDVIAEVPNPDGDLRPGMYGTMLLPLEGMGEGQGSVPLVPEAAVVEAHGSQIVFLPTATPGEYAVSVIRTGAHTLGYYEVLEGLSAGDQVVTVGTFTLKSVLLSSELGEGHAH
jgi:cobalt-zinc-cadmium efflux system membrane fusion protein